MERLTSFTRLLQFCHSVGLAKVRQHDPLWTQQIGGSTEVLRGAPAHLTLRSRPLATSRNPARLRKGSSSDGLRQEQELLWRQFFLDPALWWDSRPEKASFHSPDFRHKRSGEVLDLNNWYKPAWVDDQLAVLEMQMGRGAPTSMTSLQESIHDPGRPAGFKIGGQAVSVSTIWQQWQQQPVQALECLAGDIDSRQQELLWRQFFLEPTIWWDNRKSSRSPHFRRKGSSEVLWVNNCCKPAWVDEQLAALDMHLGRRAPTSNSKLAYKPDPGLTAVTVNAICQQGKLTEAVEALEVLVLTECPISNSLFYTVLKQCVAKKDLIMGRRVHALAVKTGFGSDTFLCNHILRMYASHARLQEAIDVFTAVTKPDAFMWSSIISAHVKHGQAKQAIQLYHQMRRSRVKPDSHAFVAALQACAGGTDLETGQQVHADVLASGFDTDLFVVNSLVDMYAKCGSLKDAQYLFDSLPQKDVVTWTTMIAGYSQQGNGQEALDLYSAMQEEGRAAPNTVTFVCLLQACASVGIPALEKGKQFHAQIKEQGFQSDVVMGCSLVNMYAKCGSLEDARGVFDRLPQKDVVTWNAMIAGYVKCGSLEDAQGLFDRLPQKNVETWNAMIAGYSQQGMGQEALDLYILMQKEGITSPNSVTFVCLLQACGSGTLALEMGKQLHAQIEERGFEADVIVGNSLVNMYAKCGSIKATRSLFDRLPQKNVVTWTAMIAGYSQQSMGQEALDLYTAMQEEGIAAPDSVTFVCLLQACASVGTSALERGKQLHAQIGERGLAANVVVCTSLVNMYAKCGSLEDAQAVFDRLRRKNVVTWNALIAGYSQQGMGQEALHLYSAMRDEGIVAPNSVTFVCLLQACAIVAALPLGKQLHADIEEQGLQGDLVVGNSLMNMYAKCGSMVDAQQVFDSLAERDNVTWGALIAGYACQGESEVVFALVNRMIEDDIQPDSITFLSLLSVCSHAGLVNKGQEYFEAMRRHYGITPTLDHYTTMVDLLGRAGQLADALEVVRTMPVQPNDKVWHALLGACQKWSNVEVGRYAFDEVVKLKEKDTAAYVLMWNIYTGAQMWEDALKIQARKEKIRAWKEPGQSWWTDMCGIVHSFLVGDKQHPESEGIYARLKQLVPKMKKEGYIPHLASSLRGISDDEKEAHLCGHSEKLAIAYALNKTPEGTTIHIVKNLRVCDDCHTATAYISQVEKRTIICRDASRFHVYKKGKCSCGDYW